MSTSSPPDYNENFAERAEKLAAVTKEAQERDERDARERQLRRRDTLFFLIRAGIALVALLFVVLVIDGLRREGGELAAHVLSFIPAANVQRAAETTSQPVRVMMDLGHHDLVITDARGTATLSFPDGSGILVQPLTRFEVRLLDYARTGRRNRSFFLRYGDIFSRISKAFGQGGQTLISTPNAVAAARGTGYTVRFDPQNNETTVEVIESKVVLKNAGGRVEITAGQRGIATGGAPPQVEPIDGNRRQQLTALLNRMRNIDKKPFPLIVPILATEHGLLTALDPLFQWVGLVPGGWNIQDNDTARKLQARKRLEDLQKAFTDEIPEQVTVHTLAEINLPEDERQRILDAFAGEMLDSYQKSGTNGYIVRARARDSKATAYELTETGVSEIKP